jgi:phosphate transport system substrate-binding protein
MAAVVHGPVTIIGSPKPWASTITVHELRTLWARRQRKITTPAVRPDWPIGDQVVRPGTESGTFDYFTDAINGRAGEPQGLHEQRRRR